MISVEDLSSVLHPMFYLTKIIGLVPFSLSKNCKHTLSIFNLISSFLIICLQGYFCISCAINFVAYPSIVLTIIEILELSSSNLNMIYFVAINYIHYRKTVEIIYNISEFDKAINQQKFKHIVDVKKSYQNNNINVFRSTIFIWLVIFIKFMMVILINADNLTPTLILSYISDTLSFCIVFEEQQFYVFLGLIKERFIWLNNITKFLINSNQNNERSTLRFHRETIKDESNIVFLRDVGILYYDLCSITKKLNKLYSGPIIVIIFKVFITAVDIFFIDLKINFISPSYVKVAETIFFIIFFPGLLFHLVKICSSTSVEAQKLKENIIENTNPIVINRRDLIDLEVLNFSLQLTHQNVNLTAGGLFVIDEKLICMMFGTVIYYCIFVLQLDLTITGESIN